MHGTTPLLFWDVDTQVDFMMPGGKLYVPQAETLLGNLGRLTAAARKRGIPVVASADDHRPEDAEISDDPDFETTYPPHCMSGTPGARRVGETELEKPLVLGHEPVGEDEVAAALADTREVLILKRTTDVFSNPNTEAVLRLLDPRHIVVYGVALDICNRKAVEGLLERGHRTLDVVVDATKPIDPQAGARLLEEWKKRGARLVTTDDVLAELSAS
jgi:nicotinamidase/pyrazinamidase